MAGIHFDIEHNGFWLAKWGEKPLLLEDALQVAYEHYQQVPKLIPVYNHRYVPAFPHERNNPIFSVYQTDIIYYGETLGDYLCVEFGMKPHNAIDFAKIKQIPFWSDF